MKKLTDRQKQLLFFVDDYRTENQINPSIRDMMDPLGLNSLRGVTQHLDALERKGYILRSKFQPRSIVFTDKGKLLLAGRKR